MPVIIALAIRAVIQMAVTLGLVDLADRFLFPYINKAIKEVAVFFGVPESEAEDIVANEFLLFAESIGIGVITLRAKLPTKLAERLGFTSKGFSKRKLSPATESKVAKAKGTGPVGTATAVVPTATEATSILSAAKTTVKGAGKALSFLEGRLGTTFLGFLVISQFIDFGNWETGAYSDTFQKLYEKITFGLLAPNEDWRKTKTASDDVFGKVYSTYQIAGATEIQDPFKNQRVPFTRDNLIDLIDHYGAQSLLVKGTASTKELLLLSQNAIIFKGGVPSLGGSSTSAPSTTTSTAKVFVGLVSQGTLGNAPSFVNRQDDLIVSTEELRQAAEQNLSAFLVSLPGKVVYQLSVVSAITTKDGFTQRGQARQIQVGTKQDGTPKMKTVVNKFAVADVFILNDKGARTKLARIVLGPTDAIAFKPDNNALAQLETSLKQSLVTSSASEVSDLKTPTPSSLAVGAVSAQTTTTGEQLPYSPLLNYKIDGSFFLDRERHLGTLYRNVGDEVWSYSPYSDIFTEKERVALSQNSGKFGLIPARLLELGVDITKFGTVPFIADITSKAVNENKLRGILNFKTFFGSPNSADLSVGEKKGASATTLSEWYTAQGQSLPSVQERSKIYAQLGLGQESYYTGTAEQNNKLLTALKNQ